MWFAATRDRLSVAAQGLESENRRDGQHFAASLWGSLAPEVQRWHNGYVLKGEMDCLLPQGQKRLYVSDFIAAEKQGWSFGILKSCI